MEAAGASEMMVPISLHNATPQKTNLIQYVIIFVPDEMNSYEMQNAL
jgi:hypothetical protein